jgi:hypothetical protein
MVSGSSVTALLIGYAISQNDLTCDRAAGILPRFALLIR